MDTRDRTVGEEQRLRGKLYVHVKQTLEREKNREKGHWENNSPAHIFHHLQKEVNELYDAFINQQGSERLWEEAADVAACAAMLADALSPKPEKPKNTAVDLAVLQLKLWKDKKETDFRVREVLEQYWAAAGIDDPDRKLGDGWPSRVPWSAAFICWVANNANPGSLTPSANHWAYAKGALAEDEAGKYRAYRPDKVPVRSGDIVVCNRLGRKMSFSDLLRYDFSPSHGDIVLEVQDGQARVAGGNVRNTVMMKQLELDKQGRYPEAIAVLRLNQ